MTEDKNAQAVAAIAKLGVAVGDALHHLLVYTVGGGDPTRIAIPRKRKRWEALRDVLPSFDWVRIVACDKDGGVLGVHGDRPERAAADADEPSEPVNDEFGFFAYAKTFSDGQLTTMKATMELASSQTAGVVNGCAQLVQSVNGALNTVLQIFHALLDYQRMAYAMAPRQSGGGDGEERDDTNDFIKMIIASQLSKFFPGMPLPGMAPPAAKPPTNGAPKPNGTPPPRTPPPPPPAPTTPPK